MKLRKARYKPSATIAPSPSGTLRLTDLTEHMLVTGSTGSGKSSCVIWPVLKRGIEAGASALCFTTKESDIADYHRVIKAAGGAVVVLDDGEPGESPRYVFDVLGYLDSIEAKTTDIAEVFGTAFELINGSGGNAGENSFFYDSARAVIIHSVELLRAIDEPLTIAAIDKTITGCRLRHSSVLDYLRRAIAVREQTTSDEPLDAAFRFLTEQWPELAEKTATSVEMVWQTLVVELQNALSSIVRAPSPGQIDVNPTTVLEQGVSVIVGPPTERAPRSGKVMQGLWQACFKLGMQRRPKSRGRRIALLVVDEFQSSTTGSGLEHYLATARSADVGVILATQSLQTVISRFGADQARSIFGLPATYVACRNDCATTNTFASERAGKKRIMVESTSSSSQSPSMGFFAAGVGSSTSGSTWSEQERPQIDPWTFQNLKDATPRRAKTESIVIRGGRYCRVVWPRTDASPRRIHPHQSYGLLKAGAMVAVGCWAVGSLLTSSVALEPEAPATSTFSNRRSQRPIVHYIERGDTLYTIARRYGVTVKSIRKLNPDVNPKNLFIGAFVRVPRRADHHE